MPRKRVPKTSVCVICGGSLAEIHAAHRTGGPKPITCSSECRKQNDNLRHLRYRKRISPEVVLCEGTPKIVAPGMLIPAVSCPVEIPYGERERRRCPSCSVKTAKLLKRQKWATRKGARVCPGKGAPCGTLLGVGTPQTKRLKYCLVCQGKVAAKAPKKHQLTGGAAAEVDWDVIRIIQESSPEDCATMREWAERVGRDPDDPATDRQWVRIKNRLKKCGYEVKVVEFDAVKQSDLDGLAINYKRWGIRVKPPRGK